MGGGPGSYPATFSKMVVRGVSFLLVPTLLLSTTLDDFSKNIKLLKPWLLKLFLLKIRVNITIVLNNCNAFFML